MTFEEDIEKEIKRIKNLPSEEQKKEVEKILSDINKQILEYHNQVLEILKYEKCVQCGKCCRQAPVNLDMEEVAEIAKSLKIDLQEFVTKYGQKRTGGGIYLKSPCPFLENKKGGKTACRIYADRPGVCKIFPFSFEPFPIAVQWVDDCHIATNITEKVEKLNPKDDSKSPSEEELLFKSVAERQNELRSEITQRKLDGVKGNAVGKFSRSMALNTRLLEVLLESLKKSQT